MVSFEQEVVVVQLEAEIHLLEQLPELFVDGRTRKGRNEDADRDALYEEIGRLKMELDWLKKKAGLLD